ncbi:MAG: hypothetical protein ACLTYX_12330 [Lachnospiraceae bacterium]
MIFQTRSRVFCDLRSQ